MHKLFSRYIHLVLHRSLLLLIGVALLTLGMSLFLPQFRLDASADSLVIDGDEDLAYSREIAARYASKDFVFVVYRPELALFSEETLADIKLLRDELYGLERVESVDSILSVPLFKLANASLSDVANNILTLESPQVDLDGAREDLLSNKAYQDVLLSKDGLTTALIVNFSNNEKLLELSTARSDILAQRASGDFSREDKAAFSLLDKEYFVERKNETTQVHNTIAEIREILTRHETLAAINMSGVPMIADDLVSFVKNDLSTFGIALLLFIVGALWFFFRTLRFVLLPLLCGSVICLTVVGLLGFLDWPVTVISSNFISLILIITVSLTVHLIVRYRELQTESPGASNETRLQLMLKSMLLPCAYTSLTTIVAFGSLVLSDIPPIVDFGLMMVIGVLCAFCLSFLLFPAVMMLMGEPKPALDKQSFDITPAIGQFTERNGMLVYLTAALMFVVSIVGISNLKVENSFIDYFATDTDIYQGMVNIDQQLGGTTPLDVIIDLSQDNPFDGAEEFADEFWEDEYEDEEGGSNDSSWFTSDKMQTIVAMHDYLDSLDETGKVLSLATLLNIAYELNDGQILNSFELGILYNRIPEAYKESLLRPYVSVADDQLRFSIRIRETDPNLVRSELLSEIRTGLKQGFNLQDEQIHLTGMLVLYNNMLQSLFASQIETIAFVMLAIFIMFVVLFRSFTLAVLGIIPNILAALSVLGLMGLAGIPLDMMTITIAAIAIGIGVDNTIHYIHRFKENYRRYGNYLHTMHYCHSSIGKAMYYTSFTIMAGFSILVFSNFVPTVYFGLLTSLAMLLALAGALSLLPLMIVRFKALGPEF